jgi:uncharacterized protein
MTENLEDQAYLKDMVFPIVEFPSDVEIDRSVDEQGVLLTLKVNPQDTGRVIGKSGNTAKSIRQLLRTFGMKNQARISLKIDAPDKPEGRSLEFDEKAI